MQESISQENKQLTQENEQLAQKNEQLVQENKQLAQENEQLAQNNEQLAQDNEQLQRNVLEYMVYINQLLQQQSLEQQMQQAQQPQQPQAQQPQAQQAQQTLGPPNRVRHIIKNINSAIYGIFNPLNKKITSCENDIEYSVTGFCAYHYDEKGCKTKNGKKIIPKKGWDEVEIEISADEWVSLRTHSFK